jgi:hypothetical protein
MFLKLCPPQKSITRRWKNICYAMVMSVRKLRHYFKAHRVRVLTNQPLNDIFGNHDSSGRIGKWAMELSEHVIDFEKRSAAKSQVLVDFIVDWTQLSSYTKGHVVASILRWNLRNFRCRGCNDTKITFRHKVEIRSTIAVHSRGRQVQQQHTSV